MNSDDLMRKIMVESPTVEVGGTTYYVVESDRTVSADQLQKYVEEVVNGVDPVKEGPPQSESLVVATVNNRMMRWKNPTILTWTVDPDSFAGRPDDFETAREICHQAADDWNAAATEQGIEDRIRFARAAEGETPVFSFKFHPFPNQPGLLALAFFPNEWPAKKSVFLGPGCFDPGILYDPVGIARHELGHVLGFRHEHIRPEAQEGLTEAQKEQMEQVVTSGMGGDNLTLFDGQSVMHYPLNGHGTTDFALTDLDKSGFGKLYRMEYDEEKIREFST